MSTVIVGGCLSAILGLSGCSFRDQLGLTTTSTGAQYSLEDLQKNIVYRASTDLEKQYAQTQSEKDLYVLIDYLVAHFQYEKAASYFTQLMKQTDQWDRARLMKLLVNDMNPDPGLYPKLAQFLANYIASGSIATDDAIYYGFTLDLLQNRFKKEHINSLTGDYTDFKNTLWRQYDLYYSYTDAPDYYLKGLFAIAYFKNQEFGVAKSLAEYAITQNANYILPYQIKAYIGLLTNQHDLALTSLDVLVQIDADNQERYQFLLGLAHYYNNDYTKASDYFLQMQSPRLKLESLRYMIDMDKKQSLALADKQEFDKKIYNKLEQLFATENLSGLVDVDFQAVFDWYVYDRLQVGSGGLLAIKQLYTQYPAVYDAALSACPNILSDKQFVCRYGTVGKLLIDGKPQEAMKLLIPLVKKYPQWQTYYIIGLLYKEQNLPENAKIYFAKALQYIDSPEQKKTLSEMTVELLNNSIK
ncbi:MAG: hypothetical protein WC004_01970 [Candidatus Absconditabacterales bacterium]